MSPVLHRNSMSRDVSKALRRLLRSGTLKWEIRDLFTEDYGYDVESDDFGQRRTKSNLQEGLGYGSKQACILERDHGKCIASEKYV